MENREAIREFICSVIVTLYDPQTLEQMMVNTDAPSPESLIATAIGGGLHSELGISVSSEQADQVCTVLADINARRDRFQREAALEQITLEELCANRIVEILYPIVDGKMPLSLPDIPEVPDDLLDSVNGLYTAAEGFRDILLFALAKLPQNVVVDEMESHLNYVGNLERILNKWKVHLDRDQAIEESLEKIAS